jgi:hypothetical protein
MLAAGPAIDTDAWSLGDAPLAFVLGALEDGRDVAVECGSGRSTIVIARSLRERGAGSLHSLEHDPAWAQLTRSRLAAEGLAEIATVVEAPLGPHPLAPEGCGWYAPWALRALPADGVGLLLVDGPPAGEPAIERSRFPAVPALAGRLADGAIVVLDDAARNGEQWVAERWCDELGLDLEARDGGEFAAACWEKPPPP